MSPRWRLIVAAGLLVGWLGVLSYTALTKSHAPIVSHAQAAAARQAVVALVTADAEGKPQPRVKVLESLLDGSPAADTELYVPNLPEARGFRGSGAYLLLLTENPLLRRFTIDGIDLPALTLVGPQRSPGHDLAGLGPPLIYQWNDEVRKQFDNLRR
jgi:hypothetical protein